MLVLKGVVFKFWGFTECLHYTWGFPGCIWLPSSNILCSGVLCVFHGKNYERTHKTRQLKIIINCYLAPFIFVSAIRKIHMWNDVFLFSKEVLLTCRIYFNYLRNKRMEIKYFINQAVSVVPIVSLNTSNLYKLIVLMTFHLLKTKTKKWHFTAHTGTVFSIN